MEGVAMVPKLLHIYSTAGTKILLSFYPYASLRMHAHHVEFQLMKHFHLCM